MCDISQYLFFLSSYNCNMLITRQGVYIFAGYSAFCRQVIYYATCSSKSDRKVSVRIKATCETKTSILKKNLMQVLVHVHVSH